MGQAKGIIGNITKDTEIVAFVFLDIKDSLVDLFLGIVITKMH